MSILSIGELLDLGNSAATAGLVPYSALEYNETGAISGISGSAIAGGVDTTIVSAIASSYVDSGMSGKADQSALDNCCSAMSAVVSAKLDASASSQFQPSGNYQPSGDYYSATNPSGFITTADITGKLDNTASSLFQPSGDYADASSLSSKLDASASGMFQPSGNYQSAGDYAFNSSLSSKLDASASSDFYLASNPSGFITGVDLDGYATTGYVESSVSGKLDATSSGQFQPSGEYAYSSSLTSYIPFSAVSGESNQITAINGSAIGNGGGSFTGVVTDDTLTGNGLPNSALGVDGYGILFDSSLYSSLDGDNVTIGVQSGIYQPSGDYYPASNPSGFISSVDLSNYATTGYVDSSVSGKLDSSASTGFYTTDNPSGFITGVDLSNYATTAYVDSSVSGKQDTLTFAYDVDKISAINGSALAGGGGGGATGDYYEKSATEIAYGPSATATKSSLSIGLASSNYGSIAINATVFSTADSAVASVGSVAVGQRCTAKSRSLSLGRNCSANEIGIAVGDTAAANGGSLAFGYSVTASSLSIAAGQHVTANNTAVALGKYNLCGNGNTSTGNSAAFVIGDGTADSARHDLMLVTKDGEITMYSGTADTIGTGIMSSIRALSANGGGVDSATVSAIASAYQVVSSLSADGSYVKRINDKYISASNAFNAEYAKRVLTGNEATATAYISSLGGVDSATVSAIASSYAESAASGKQDTLTFSYDVDKISAINGSAIAGGGGGGAGDYVEKSATNLAIGSSVDAQNDDTFAQGRYCSSNSRSFVQGFRNRASSDSFVQGSYNTANECSFAQGSVNDADMYSFAQGYHNTAYDYSFARGMFVSAINSATVIGQNNLSGDGFGASGAAFVIGDGTDEEDARHDLMVVTKNGEITMYSSTADTVGTGVMDSIRSLSAAVSGVTALLDAI